MTELIIVNYLRGILPKIVLQILDETSAVVIGGCVIHAVDQSHPLKDIDVFIPEKDMRHTFDILMGENVVDLRKIPYGMHSYKVTTLTIENMPVDFVFYTEEFNFETCIDFGARQLRFDGKEVLGPIEEIQKKVLRYNRGYTPLDIANFQVKSLIESGRFDEKNLNVKVISALETLKINIDKYRVQGWSIEY